MVIHILLFLYPSDFLKRMCNAIMKKTHNMKIKMDKISKVVGDPERQ